MSELRWVLILLGILLLAGIVWWSRRAPPVSADDARVRREPELGDAGGSFENPEPPMDEEPMAPDSADVADFERGDQLTIPMPAEHPDEVTPPEPEPIVADKIVKLHLVASDGVPFVAADVVATLRAEKLRFAHYDLFHRFEGEGNPTPTDRPIFSVSDMLKPGTFDLETLAEKQLKGISLFLALPSPTDGVAAFADMLATGRRLAATLGGQLVDEQGCSVSRQSASHMREDIINYQLASRAQADDE